MTEDEVELCSTLEFAACALQRLTGAVASSYSSEPAIAAFIVECNQQIEAGTFGVADKVRLWKIFAPTCDWDDVVGDVDLGNKNFELVQRLYGDEIRKALRISR